MSFFQIHPDDARWLKRFLRNNLACFLLIVSFVMALRWMPTSADEFRDSTGIGAFPATEIASADVSAIQSGAVWPRGWRLTKDGWENASRWPIRRPLAEIIISQRAQEPAWIQSTLAHVRAMPPLLFALLQVTLIALIVRYSSAHRRSPLL